MNEYIKTSNLGVAMGISPISVGMDSPLDRMRRAEEERLRREMEAARAVNMPSWWVNDNPYTTNTSQQPRSRKVLLLLKG